MGRLDRFRRWIWKVEESSNKLEYSVIEAVDRAEVIADEHTGGRVTNTLERIDDDSEELLEKLHFDHDPGLPEDEPPEKSSEN